MTPREAFREQSVACQALGSPFMARLLSLAADRLTGGTPVADRILGWKGNPESRADSLPLRFGGGLHALKFEGLALTDYFPPNECTDEALWEAVLAAMGGHSRHLLQWLDSPSQTNEVRRSAAVIPVLHILAQRFGLPIALSELGCSGGLNLHADAFRLRTPQASFGPLNSAVQLAPDWTGPAPAPADVIVADRAGVDLFPIDPQSAEGRLRLLAYLWADQPDRIARTEAAIALARLHPARIERGDAADWLVRRLAKPMLRRTHLIFHTVAWQYFPSRTQTAAEEAIAAAGANATKNAPSHASGWRRMTGPGQS